jgi:hypothetical protein
MKHLSAYIWPTGGKVNCANSEALTLNRQCDIDRFVH